jgi:hypothetical protein
LEIYSFIYHRKSFLIKTEPFFRDSPAFSANFRVFNPNLRGIPPSPLTKASADFTKALAQTSDQ